MNEATSVSGLPEEKLTLLRKSFESHQISLLPKPFKKDSEKGKCKECGGYHGLPAAHLEYVGHAATTDRLLDVDLGWTWEPMAVDSDGLPKLDPAGNLWIRLTICGVTRLGYGDAQGKTGGDAMKERIGDAIRNAAMRFGVALELWHKGILHMDIETEDDKVKFVMTEDWTKKAQATTTVEALDTVWKAGVKEIKAYCESVGDRAAYDAFKHVVEVHGKTIESKGKA